MRWVYRIQQRLAITHTESTVLLGLAALFVLGLAVRYVQTGSRPFAPDVYADEQAAFEALSAAPLAPADTADTGAYSAPTTVSEFPPTPVEGPVDLNTATAAALQRLPRIGPKTAARIIAYREAHGPFRRVQDLVRVRGIGPKTLAGLEPLVVVGDIEATGGEEGEAGTRRRGDAEGKGGSP